MWKFHPPTKTNQNVTPLNIQEERLYYTTTFCDELVLDLHFNIEISDGRLISEKNK